MIESSVHKSMLKFKEQIRVGATVSPPFVLECFRYRQEQCAQLGIDLEYLYNLLVHVLHANVSWVAYDSFDDLTVALNNNEIDIIGNTLVVPTVKTNFTDSALYHTPPSTFLGVGFFVKEQPRIDKAMNIFSAFSWDLWICLTFITLFYLSLKKVISNHQVFYKSRKGINFCYFFWFFVIALILELYDNLFAVELAVPTLRSDSVFKDLVDLGQKLVRKQCRIVVYDTYFYEEDFIHIFYPTHAGDWANYFKLAYDINPPMMVHDKASWIQYIRNSSCVVGLDFVSYDDTGILENICGVEVKTFPAQIPFQPFVYYHKLHHLVPLFDVIFASDSFLKLSEVLLRKYIYTFEFQCKSFSSTNSYYLTVSHLYVAFVLWLGGLGLAGFMLLLQKLWPNGSSMVYIVN